MEKYRPVSFLPFVAKTLERVVFNQLSLFLSQYNKLDAKQSGFRSGPSTETLLSVTEALRIAKADSKLSVLILLDLSAAFDTVNHQILLSTLSSLGITGIPLRWFESYLTGRSFRVAWGGEVSKAQRGSKSLSRTFSFTVPGWWNNLPTPIRNAGSLSIFKQQLKTHLFRHYLTSS